MTTYKNPWHKRFEPMYGPAEYITNVQPEEYKGFLIYERIDEAVWDVVKDGACVTQRAGINGAKRYIDEVAE
jgi:hypothetical protein